MAIIQRIAFHAYLWYTEQKVVVLRHVRRFRVRVLAILRRRRGLTCTILGVLLLIFIGIHILFTVRWIIQHGPNGKKASQVFLPRNLSGRTVSMSMAVQSVDVDANLLTLNWEITGDSCTGDLQLAPTQSNCGNVNIYIPPNLLIVGSGTSPATTDPFNSSTIVWDANTFMREGYGLRLFQTYLALTTGSTHTSSYPFDQYESQVIIHATESGSLVNVQILRATSSVAAYSIRFKNMNTDTTVGLRYAQYAISVRRGIVVKIYVFTVMLAVWFTSVLFASIAVGSVVLNRHVPIEILLVPLGAFFGFPQLRTTLPGIPDVSAVDYVSLHPCLVILSLSAVFMVMVFIYRMRNWKDGSTPIELHRTTNRSRSL